MDEQQFDFRPSRLAPAMYMAAYGAAGWLLYLVWPATVSRLVAALVLAGLAAHDLYRCGFLGPARVQGLALRQQRWWLKQHNQWQAADVALHHRGTLCLIICWRKPASPRVYYTVIWRDRLRAPQWRLLLVYFSLLPATPAGNAWA
ncbi:MAG: hypothetical protein KJO24_04010 [Gammaproteobacteria bacterium]|nr:hypothetical protein [Gammaproteobacteria bacterium]